MTPWIRACYVPARHESGLTFGARGLLTYLLGQGNGTRIDIRLLAERNPEGRQAEAATLAPLVEAWLERGATERELRTALADGLPARIHSVVGPLKNRLCRKLPPPLAAVAEPVPAQHECASCQRPGLAAPGICRSCAGLGDRPPHPAFPPRSVHGPALVRAALHGRLVPG